VNMCVVDQVWNDGWKGNSTHSVSRAAGR